MNHLKLKPQGKLFPNLVGLTLWSYLNLVLVEPSDAKMKKQVSFARTPQLYRKWQLMPMKIWLRRHKDEAVDYNPGLVDHSSSLGIQPSFNVMQWMSYSKQWRHERWPAMLCPVVIKERCYQTMLPLVDLNIPTVSLDSCSLTLLFWYVEQPFWSRISN